VKPGRKGEAGAAMNQDLLLVLALLAAFITGMAIGVVLAVVPLAFQSVATWWFSVGRSFS
jgi:hypothetical protein